MGNRITRLDSNTFPPISLITLSLEENRLESLDRAAFSSLPTLQSL